ncbi:hypothetical protein [Sandaracinus amylolyticus]|uniref:Uncharacterized protein n=1 Tax=Sandaracinus amylolyticus TaxID=927083 RepID=A0A0F6YLH9_9BACT|nr:hypothetical protein [Sandaracinus amylolyticus]AKF09482.1 hypothetical protein DB32_006631 [Sandaracinus amylolyticus]
MRLAALVMIVLTSACGSVARSVATEVPEPLIHESLRTLAQEDTQALAAEVFASPEVRSAMRELAATMTDGALDALGEEERAARMTEAIEALAARIVAAVAAAMDRELAPVVVSTVERSVDAATRELVSEQSRDRLAAGLSDVTDRVIVSASGTVREELRDVLTHPETQELLRATVRGIAEESVRGTERAVREARQAREAEGRAPSSVVASFERTVRRSAQLLDLLVLGAAIGLVGLVVWMARRSRRMALREMLARRREVVTLALLARLAQRGEDVPPELRRALERVLRESEPAARPKRWWRPAFHRDQPA